MTRILHIVREFFRNLGRNPFTALSSLLSLALLFLLFDLFWIAAGTSEQFYRNLIAQVRLEAYVAESVPDSTMANLALEVRTTPGVANVVTITRDSARSRLADMVGADLLVGYDADNPLPRSFMITLEDAALNAVEMERIETGLMGIVGIEAVAYSRDWLIKAEETKRLMWQVGLVLGILIIAAAVISSANNIRLMTRARAVGFRQMLLLGAGKIFISLPFVIEGFLVSGLAAAIGWGVIWYEKSRIALSQIEIIYPNSEDILYYCLAAAVLGALSGFLGLRRQLKV